MTWNDGMRRFSQSNNKEVNDLFKTAHLLPEAEQRDKRLALLSKIEHLCAG
jgi:hypothetical protein